jgi:hypothetical protein
LCGGRKRKEERNGLRRERDEGEYQIKNKP